jgi:hypothetical protein
MPFIDLDCDCGGCDITATIRKGDVYVEGELIHKEELYITVYDEGYKEIMVSPKDAKELLSFMLWEYSSFMKPVRLLTNWFRKYYFYLRG